MFPPFSSNSGKLLRSAIGGQENAHSFFLRENDSRPPKNNPATAIMSDMAAIVSENDVFLGIDFWHNGGRGGYLQNMQYC